MERGIDKLKVGQLIVIGIAGMMDENFYPGENQKENIENEVDNRVRVPGIILNKHENYDSITYDVGFWTRSRTGEMSGMLKMEKQCIWRYFSSDTVEEGTPPEWLIKGLENDPIDGLDSSDIFYIKAKDDNQENDYEFYPYK